MIMAQLNIPCLRLFSIPHFPYDAEFNSSGQAPLVVTRQTCYYLKDTRIDQPSGAVFQVLATHENLNQLEPTRPYDIPGQDPQPNRIYWYQHINQHDIDSIIMWCRFHTYYKVVSITISNYNSSVCSLSHTACACTNINNTNLNCLYSNIRWKHRSDVKSQMQNVNFSWVSPEPGHYELVLHSGRFLGWQEIPMCSPCFSLMS